MPTKTAATTQPSTPGAIDPATADLAALREQKRQLDAAIKAAKASQPQRDRLSAEIAKQETHPNASLVYCVGGMARRRIAAGQPREEATEGVLRICRRLIDQALDAPASDGDASAE